MNIKNKTILLLGPPGTGKSTVAMQLRKTIAGIKQFSVRVYSEHLMMMDTELGQFIRKHNQVGKKLYMPDKIVIEVFSHFLDQIKDEDFLLIEGFPINLMQQQGMDRELARRGRSVSGIILLFLEKEFLYQRIRNRVVCRDCERLWGAGIPLMREYKTCPYCNGKLEIRREDSKENFEMRMDNFERESNIILKIYSKQQIRRIYALDRKQVWIDVKKYLEEL